MKNLNGLSRIELLRRANSNYLLKNVSLKDREKLNFDPSGLSDSRLIELIKGAEKVHQIRSREEFVESESISDYETSLLNDSGFEIISSKSGIRVIDRNLKKINLFDAYDLLATLARNYDLENIGKASRIRSREETINGKEYEVNMHGEDKLS